MSQAEFSCVSSMLNSWRPAEPVYCIYPEVYRENTQRFINGFPGRVLYAVKANDEPAIIRQLADAGICHFDCASLPEIAGVKASCPEGSCYFMIPTRIRGAARVAQGQYGVRHFLVDHEDGLAILKDEVDLGGSVVFARMAVHHSSAAQDLSSKFGAPPAHMPSLLACIRASGAEPALAFNVGSSVKDPQAYGYGIGIAAEVIRQLPFSIRLVDIGGGFPKSYPNYTVPALEAYFETIRETVSSLPLAANAEILCEPGRALAAPGLSAVVEVLLRKDDRLYINDGMFGVFWELRYDEHDQYPVRVYRDGKELEGEDRSYSLYGPTCDGADKLPGKLHLPADIGTGDYLEFGELGAYSLGGRTRFNGYFSDTIVRITGDNASMPG